MGRLPLGSVSPYVKMSSGGSMDPMKFYATSYGTAYGQEKFHPRVGCHLGTGYKSNYPPVVYYKSSLDRVDNPAMGLLLRDNYESVTTQHFRPLQVPDGKCPLPWSVHQAGSGFVREKPISCPTVKAGPHYMSTEYNSKFRFEMPRQPDFLQRKTIGVKEETGFTEEVRRNLIVPQPLRSQPGISITKTDFLPSTIPHGDEFLPVLAKGSKRETGFSQGATDPKGSVPSLRVEDSGPLSHSHFQGLQRPLQTQTKLLGREYVGKKEPSGFSINNGKYVTPPYDPDMPNQYLTSYNSMFYEKMLKGVDREGWTRGGIQPQQPGGFTTNNHVTDLGSDPNATETLRRVHPHVGRVITTVDPFYRDSPHDHRFSALHQTAVPE
ncbi:protein phosphatase 1 regulatory subunit 32 isoform X2 [Alligator mississippiensis]|uniref:protein phosphatase 1 regulatory subunit 32 isoform X2 n=1 Tax=Alligator mississippiensis TaxID=8496 RepID=UPI0009070BC6|nr:protein phosphatase 1 regulatory subunit 32 isoform X2 [Alligator mississippiensis]